MARRQPYELDLARINELLEQREGYKIQDADSYELAYNDYMGIVKTDKSQRIMRDNAFTAYVNKHPEVSKEHLFKKAKGRDLSRDRLRTAKKVVTTRRAYIKGGARHLDLKGYDTARQRITKQQRIERTFTVPARIRQKVVYAMRTSVVVKGHRVLRHRDSRGRFASIKIKRG